MVIKYPNMNTFRRQIIYMNSLFRLNLGHLSIGVGVKQFIKSINVVVEQTKLERLFVGCGQITSKQVAKVPIP